MTAKRSAYAFPRVLDNSQRGVITLVISLVILMLSTLVVFNVSKAVLMEQKISNNDNRAKQSFEAAEAGMNMALTYLGDDPDRDGDGCIDPVFDLDVDGVGQSNTLTLAVGGPTVEIRTRPAGAACVPPETMTDLQIESQGFSDDKSATRIIAQIMATIDPLPNRPQNPLIVRGNVDINGSATIENMEGFSTIWTGKDVDLGSSNSVSTKVPDISDTTSIPGYPACMDTPLTCTSVQTSDKQGVGVDVIENDSSLGNLSDNEFFQNFFGMGPDAYRAAMATIDAAGNVASAASNEAAHEVVWIEGDAEFSGTWLGCADKDASTCAAADIKPSILIVRGTATFSGNPKFWGLVFVLGDAKVTAGTTEIYGALVVTGKVETSGSLDIRFTSDVLGGTALAGGSTGSAGTWKDF